MLDWVVCVGLIVIGALVLALDQVAHEIRRLAGIAERQTPRRPRRPVVDVDVVEIDRKRLGE